MCELFDPETCTDCARSGSVPEASTDDICGRWQRGKNG